MRKTLVTLLGVSALAITGGAFAASSAQQTVTVRIPSYLRLTVATTDVAFNFNGGAETASVIMANHLNVASLASYIAFLGGSANQTFAPSGVADKVPSSVLTVVSNSGKYSITATYSGSGIASGLKYNTDGQDTYNSLPSGGVIVSSANKALYTDTVNVFLGLTLTYGELFDFATATDPIVDTGTLTYTLSKL
ncbi:MAG TPA: hypothetical protein VHN99_00530 [Deinococcales bacterium]|nr:hypothetical protein [Deinococcales bacterium]